MDKSAPSWFTSEIATGLQTLYTLCLDGTPAADVFQTTVRVWVHTLWGDQRVGWIHDDVPRIRGAFASLRQSCERWPAPARFMAALPSRPPAPALPARIFTPEELEKNRERLANIIHTLIGESTS